MHYLLNVIVKAEDATDAVDRAESFMNDLVERGEFDWFDMDGRWGKSEAKTLDSEDGKKAVEQSMESTRDNFNRSMAAIRHMVEHYSDEEIFEERFNEKDAAKTEHYLSRYQFSCAYGQGSGNAFLYGDNDVWGSAIDNQKDLTHVMQDTTGLFVVNVDAHN